MSLAIQSSSVGGIHSTSALSIIYSASTVVSCPSHAPTVSLITNKSLETIHSVDCIPTFKISIHNLDFTKSLHYTHPSLPEDSGRPIAQIAAMNAIHNTLQSKIREPSMKNKAEIRTSIERVREPIARLFSDFGTEILKAVETDTVHNIMI